MAWVRPLVAAGCCLGDPLSQAYLLDIESLLAFFERQGLACLVNADRTEIAVPNPDREGWALRILPRDGRGLITFAYPLPGAIPEDRVTALVSAANQLNARTLIGAWVLNTSARELIFRLTVQTDGVLYTDPAVLALLQMVVGAVDDRVRYLDGVLKGGSPA